MKAEVEAYSDRIHYMKKTLSEHEKLQSKLKEKEKEALKLAGDAKADRRALATIERIGNLNVDALVRRLMQRMRKRCRRGRSSTTATRRLSANWRKW